MKMYRVIKDFVADPPCPGTSVPLKKGDLLELAYFDLHSSEFNTMNGQVVSINRVNLDKPSTESYECYSAPYQNLEMVE